MAFNVASRRSPFIKNCNVSLVSCASINTENIRVIDKPTLESAKRGTGYRSSFNGIVCTIFGGSGFYGRNIINRLGKYGTQIIIPHRCAWPDISMVRTSSDLGQMQFCDFDLANEDSIRKAVKYSDVVINLIGKDWDTRNYTLEKVNIDGARKIAKICREMGVKKLIHTSSINASPNPREVVIKGGSRFLKSKWFGEQAVREEFPDAIIVRPSETYGHLDRYFSYYGSPFRLIFSRLYLVNKGLDTIKQPVYVGDICSGFSELVKRPLKDVAGKTYQFVGPRRYVQHDLLRYIFDHYYKDEEFYGFRIEDSRYDVFFYLLWHFYSRAYFVQPTDGMCWETFERENLTDHFDDSLPNLRDLGVQLNNIESHVWGNTRVYRAQREWLEEASEYQQPPGPPFVHQI